MLVDIWELQGEDGAAEKETPPRGRSEVTLLAIPYDESLLEYGQQSPLKYTKLTVTGPRQLVKEATWHKD
jgi:hypothetical protein